MAGSVNKVILVGNLGKEPEIRFMPDGTKVANFSVATSETWRDKTTGERKDRTEWHRVSVMNDKLADVCEKYLRKGSKVYVEGQLQNRKWTDQSGAERMMTEVTIGRFRGELTLLDNKSNGSSDDFAHDDHQGFQNQNFAPTQQRANEPMNRGSQLLDLDDDVPF